MRRTPTFLAATLLLCSSLLSGCGGHTGFELKIHVPAELAPGLDFDSLRIRVEAVEGGVVEENFEITEASLAPPYIVYVHSDTTTHYKASIRAQLWQNNAMRKTKLLPDVQIKDGELLPIDIAFD